MPRGHFIFEFMWSFLRFYVTFINRSGFISFSNSARSCRWGTLFLNLCGFFFALMSLLLIGRVSSCSQTPHAHAAMALTLAHSSTKVSKVPFFVDVRRLFKERCIPPQKADYEAIRLCPFTTCRLRLKLFRSCLTIAKGCTVYSGVVHLRLLFSQRGRLNSC